MLREVPRELSSNNTVSAAVPPTRKYMGARCFTNGEKFGFLKREGFSLIVKITVHFSSNDSRLMDMGIKVGFLNVILKF